MPNSTEERSNHSDPVMKSLEVLEKEIEQGYKNEAIIYEEKISQLEERLKKEKIKTANLTKKFKPHKPIKASSTDNNKIINTKSNNHPKEDSNSEKKYVTLTPEPGTKNGKRVSFSTQPWNQKPENLKGEDMKECTVTPLPLKMRTDSTDSGICRSSFTLNLRSPTSPNFPSAGNNDEIVWLSTHSCPSSPRDNDRKRRPGDIVSSRLSLLEENNVSSGNFQKNRIIINLTSENAYTSNNDIEENYLNYDLSNFIVDKMFKYLKLDLDPATNANNSNKEEKFTLLETTFLEQLDQTLIQKIDPFLAQYRSSNEPLDINNPPEFINTFVTEVVEAACINYFLFDTQLTKARDYISAKLEDRLADFGLKIANYKIKIKQVADKIVREVLEEANIREALASAVDPDNANDEKNLITMIDDQLTVQIDQQIDPAIPVSILTEPNDYLAAILNKVIFNTRLLSDTELQALLKPHASLQYMDNKKDFSLALSALYPSAGYPGVSYPADFTVSNELFKKVRKLLRDEALEKIKGQYPESRQGVDAEDIESLMAIPWLEKKYQLITGKSTDLRLHAAEQERFNRGSQQLFDLSELCLAAVTPKSIAELKKELDNLADFKLRLIAEGHQHLLKIEETLLAYPALIKLEDFIADLNTVLTDLSFNNENHTAFQVDAEQAKSLLRGINQHIADLNNKWGLFNLDLNAPQAVATTGINALPQRFHQQVAPYKDKWNSLLLNSLVEKIYLDIKPSFTSDHNSCLSELKAKDLILTAINLLHSRHGLKERLEERTTWNKEIKHDYAMIKKIQACRDIVTHSVIILKEIKLKKETEPTPIKSAASSTPGPVYLPASCHILDNHEEFLVESKNNYFNRRDPLKLRERIHYRQFLNDKKHYQDWSVTRHGEHSLAYHSKRTWYQRLSKEVEKEVTFTQMIDAVNSFKDSELIDFSFSSSCPRETEKKYRLFISVYNQLRQESGKGPLLYCSPNPRLKIKDSEIAAEKEEIKHKLTLNAHEPVIITQQLSTYARARG